MHTNFVWKLCSAFTGPRLDFERWLWVMEGDTKLGKLCFIAVYTHSYCPGVTEGGLWTSGIGLLVGW